ncbi:MAG: transketolase family protein [Candidatus Nitrosocosmicus sp.]|jgi:transketolase|nr:transketolase [Candidatus Nitrosocosmicus sp.]
MRSAYGESLVNLGKKYPNIVCVGGDTTDSLKTKKFGEMFPDRLFNVGIAEANLVSIAAGLAIAEKISFASTYAAFIPGRCLDQIRNAICYPNLDVKIVVSHAGLSVGPDGASHQQIEDISIMRSLPNMRVLVPADAPSVKKLLENIVQIPGPFYVRLARPSTEELYPEETDFEIGKGKVVTDGADLSIFACGTMVSASQKASDTLKKEHGISCRVIDMYSIKPIDTDLIYKCAKETGSLISVEEHNVVGGLGSAISEVTSDICPTFVRKIGIKDKYGESARDEEIDSLLDKYGLSPKEIVRNAVELNKREKK